MSWISKRNSEQIQGLTKNLDIVREAALKTELGQDFAKEELEDWQFASNLEIIHNTVEKSYLNSIASQYRPIPLSIKNFSYTHRTRMLKIKKWVTEEKERALDKLVNVYSALSGVECSIALVFRRVKSGTTVYFVITNQSDKIDPAIVDSYYDMFVSALKGNFPGVEIEDIQYLGTYHEPDIRTPIGEWFSEANSNAVAMITNVASESSEQFISQGIEKLLDGVVPTDGDTEYTLVLLASPMSKQEIYEQMALYGNLYTQLSPFASHQVSVNKSESITRSKFTSNTVSIGGSISSSTGVNLSILNKSYSFAMNSGYAHTSGKSDAATKTSGETLTSTQTNYRVKEALENIEANIKRLQQGDALGLWNFATYVLADNYSVAQSVSNMYRSLTQGEKSYVESAAVNIWNDNRPSSKSDIDVIEQYLMAFTHPVFALNGIENYKDAHDNKKVEEKIKKENADAFRKNVVTMPEIVSGCTRINGRELAMAMNMPTAAVSGLPVIECAEFGRDVISQSIGTQESQKINLGNIFHMQQEEVNKPVQLDANCMTEHTFITGSTGAGKSTTIYHILHEASELKADEDKKVTFMVIEPAKGEYKRELAKLSKQKINVYGTNPKEGGLLKINPFAFPKDIHILEHLDRLIEIFNVCWPMYAAMPAVLKKGIEEAYVACGWDLVKSENIVDPENTVGIFPTFADVSRHIRIVIDESDYSADNKGDYKGALVTRLESLTNGINGLIFTADEIQDKELFEHNSVVDLSRVGSTETKALIMGLLIMKLQEYRMTPSSGSNAALKHITVLEEAHNLLKRTSTEQSSETANLLGKSVEMLSNSIAEMRTYGEAFIIADQAPGLLDMSVIRNTNTKIIMRLPDYSDRELVGRAANLNDEQIIEIAKLRPGVAAVYYNGWIAPVLCKVPKQSENSEKKIAANCNDHPDEIDTDDTFPNDELIDMIVRKKDHMENVDAFCKKMKKAGCSGELVMIVHKYWDAKEEEEKNKLLPKLFYALFEPEKIIKKVQLLSDGAAIRERLVNELQLDQYRISQRDQDRIILNLLHEHTHHEAEFAAVYGSFVAEYQRRWIEGGTVK